MSLERTSHLTAAMISLFALMASLVGYNFYAQALELRYVNALAPLNLTQMENGDSLQRAALQKPDLLMMYGSSELTLLPTPYQADQFFAKYPTGFTVVDVASLGVLSRDRLNTRIEFDLKRVLTHGGHLLTNSLFDINFSFDGSRVWSDQVSLSGVIEVAL